MLMPQGWVTLPKKNRLESVIGQEVCDLGNWSFKKWKEKPGVGRCCHMTATQCLTLHLSHCGGSVCNDTWITHCNSTLNLFHNEQKLDGCVGEINRRDTGGRNSLSILLYSQHPGSPSDSC